MTNGGQPAGWHPDPWHQARSRWWDGERWTEHVDGDAPPAPVAVAPVAAPIQAPAAVAPLEPAPVSTGPFAAAQPAGVDLASPWPAAPAQEPGLWGPQMPTLEDSRSLLWVICGFAAMVLVGSVLPWAHVKASFIDATVDGMDGDGVLTLGAAIGFGGFALGAFLGRASRWKVVIALVLAVLTVLTAIVDIVDINSRVAELGNAGTVDFDVEASVGIGLWLVLLGAVGATAALAFTLTRIRKT